MSQATNPTTNEWRGRRVTVWGLGCFGGGVAVARFLALQGAQVTVTDLKPAEALGPSVAALDGLEIRFVLGEHREQDLLEADLVVKSPAIPPSAAWLARIRAAGVPVTSELALGMSRLRGPCVLVTGSKGKSTTSGLLGAMADAPVAGNNERPLLDVVDDLPAGQPVILEISSFMAHDLQTAWLPAGAALPTPVALVLTSLEEEHINWHGTYQDYVEAKLSLLDYGCPAILPEPGLQPELERWVAKLAPGRQLLRPEPIDDTPGLRLLGPHNRSNAQLAARAARLLGADPAGIAAGAARFEPLPHRLETVATSPCGVRFVNDSTATTPRAAAAALDAVPQPVVLLAGGSDKGASFAELGQAAARRAHQVICLGAVGERVALAVEAALAERGGTTRVQRTEACFEEAFAQALAACPAGGTVLLAPGTASYDMFPNFKARGERFRALAQEACRGT
jgi:UDP-N-acetylmuramoylalanine--D-glutamate ligase